MAVDSPRRHIKRLEEIKGAVEKVLAVAVLRGGTVIQLRAKEILLENRHFITGTLHRSINVQLGKVTKEYAEALIGTPIFYGKYVERLDDGGYLFRAAEEKLGDALAVAGRSLDEAIRAAAR